MKKIFAVMLALVMMLSMGSALAETYTFAVIGPMTGGAAVYGTAVANGAQIAADEINAAAGEEVIKLIIEDDIHDSETSIHAYHDALDDHAQAIIGCVTSTPCKSVAKEAYEDRVFMLTPSATNTEVTEDKDNCYQLCFTDPAQGVVSAQYIIEHNLGSNIGVIYNISDSYSTGIYDAFKAELEKSGMSIVAAEAFKEGDVDFSTQVNKMKAAGCDLVFLPIYYTPASQILTQADAIEYAPLFFGVDGMDGILTKEGFDAKLAEGVMLLCPFAANSTDEATVNFVTKYVAQYTDVPNQFAADAYDCVYAMYAAFQAIEATSEDEADDLCDALIEVFSTSLEITGLTGTMTWNAEGTVEKAPIVFQIKEGSYVFPEDY